MLRNKPLVICFLLFKRRAEGWKNIKRGSNMHDPPVTSDMMTPDGARPLARWPFNVSVRSQGRDTSRNAGNNFISGKSKRGSCRPSFQASFVSKTSRLVQGVCVWCSRRIRGKNEVGTSGDSRVFCTSQFLEIRTSKMAFPKSTESRNSGSPSWKKPFFAPYVPQARFARAARS